MWKFLTAPTPLWAFLLLALLTVKWWIVKMWAHTWYLVARFTILYRRLPTFEEIKSEYEARYGFS